MKINYRILAVVTWMAVIFFFTQLPYFTGENTFEIIRRALAKEQAEWPQTGGLPFDLEVINMVIRKIAHFLVFGIFAILLFKCIRNVKGAYFITWMAVIIYAASDEWHQSFVPGRAPLVTDVLIDTAGASVALFFTFLYSRKREKRVSDENFKERRF